MEISYLVVMILPLVINAIQVSSLSTGTRKLGNREDAELVLAGYRCYNFPNCGWLEVENGTWKIENGCGKSKVRAESEKLEDLKEACLNDDNCIAVSCEDKVSDDKEVCSRYMLSTYCDSTTIDDENNWTIHLLKPTNTGVFRYVQTGTCESNGMTSIRDAIACSYAAAEFERSSTDVIVRAGTFGKPSGRPTGCSWHNSGNLELWLYNTGECNVNGYAGCFCLLNDFA